jgi:WD40 repeat protein
VQDITFDHSVERVMTASSDRTLRIWDVSSGRSVMVLEGHAKGVNQARFAGDLIVSGDYEGEVRMWDRTSGRLLEVLPGAGAFIIKLVSGPGWIVVGSERGVIRWDIGLLDEAAEIAWGDDCRLPYFWDHGRLSRRSFTECPERPLN